MTPSDARGGTQLIVGATTFYIGLFLIHLPVEHPDILTPVLLRKDGDQWIVEEEYDPLMYDLQENFRPIDMAKLIVMRFGPALKNHATGDLSWSDELALILSTKLSIVDGNLVLTE